MIRIILAIFLTIAPAFAGELTRRDIRRSTEWEPSGCSKPYKPSYYVSDVDSFNQAVDEFNSYVSEVRSYIQCVNSEAAADFDTLKKILEESLSSQISEANSELDSARSSLELQRP